MGFDTLPRGYTVCKVCNNPARVLTGGRLSCGCPPPSPTTDSAFMFGGGRTQTRTTDPSPVALRSSGQVYRPWTVEIDQPTIKDRKTKEWRPVPVLNANRKMHHQEKGRHVKRWRQASYEAVAAAQIPRLAFITVGLLIRPPDRHTRDASNLMPVQKPIVDGIVDAGVVEDDSTDYVLELVPKIWTPTGQQGVWKILLIIADGRRGIAPDDLLK